MEREEGVARPESRARGVGDFREGINRLFARGFGRDDSSRVQFEIVDVVGDAIEQRTGQTLGPERVRPFVERQLCYCSRIEATSSTVTAFARPPQRARIHVASSAAARSSSLSAKLGIGSIRSSPGKSCAGIP